MTFLGAMSGRPAHDAQTPAEPTVVIDIGGGSTEFIVGSGHTAGFHVSLQAGVVRDERAPHPLRPARPGRAAGARGRRARDLSRARPADERAARDAAGSRLPAPPPRRPRSNRSSTRTTPSVCTATAAACHRRAVARAPGRHGPKPSAVEVAGLHPDRAPTIVAGMVLLVGGDAGVRARRGRGLRARHPLRWRTLARRRRLTGHGPCPLENTR